VRFRDNPKKARDAVRMKGLYESVCEQWNKLYDEMEGDLVVGACGNSQKFLQISEATPVCVFLTYPDPDMTDVLIKVCWR